ncbi:hypothetical protein XENTR_v10020931 [Xenopus tropicalis]|nr:hypothetical protein XENTR_v10020931 [Xenopus tropicalis]KAE8584365.1 hypothetical protein XENTR_v10020931 [Xenopus tropicalis]
MPGFALLGICTTSKNPVCIFKGSLLHIITVLDDHLCKTVNCFLLGALMRLFTLHQSTICLVSGITCECCSCATTPTLSVPNHCKQLAKPGNGADNWSSLYQQAVHLSHVWHPSRYSWEISMQNWLMNFRYILWVRKALVNPHS